jgi:hypothetical protein
LVFTITENYKINLEVVYKAWKDDTREASSNINFVRAEDN